MTRSKSNIASLAVLGSIFVLACPSMAAWTVTGTVKDTKGATLADVAVTVKDSANLKTTSNSSGSFTLSIPVGVIRENTPRGFSVQQSGNDLLISMPGHGAMDLSLVNLAGATLWSGSALLENGFARVSMPSTSHYGPAILRLAVGGMRVSQPLTLLGGDGAAVTPRVSARAQATYPTLVFKKVGFADTTFTLTQLGQTNISVAMRDSTTPKSTTCKLPPSPNPGSGSFTNYWFGQGSWKEDGYYKTACGYRGTEPNGQSSDQMNNIANPQYFLAIPGNSSSDFNTNGMCGACVELTGQNGTKLVATITDECPNDINAPCKSNPNGHLDVSYPAFSKLGFSIGNPTGTTWKYVKCPVTGNVFIRVKNGNANQIYVENSILPIKDVKVGSNSATHLSYGAWQISRTALGATVTIVDYSDRTITVTIPQSIGTEKDWNSGVQFPACQ